jgi:hypothetical protein
MRTVDSNTQAALAARSLVARDFIQISGKAFAGGAAHTAYFWSDFGTISATIVDGETGTDATNTYIGTATLLKIDDVPLTSDITIRQIRASLSQINSDVADAVRAYDLKLGKVQIHRGLFDPDTRALVAKPLPRFVGFVDKSVITTPQEGGEGSIVLTLTGHTQELTRTNSDTCSDASQKVRNSGDAFYIDMSVTGTRHIFWGQLHNAIAADKTAALVAGPNGKWLPLS